MNLRSRPIHRLTAVFSALLLCGSLCMNSFAAAPNKKRYLRQIDQQLSDLERGISRLKVRRRSLQGPERERLVANVQMLEGKLHEVRHWRAQIGRPDSEWLSRKKGLDEKVIRLRKSLTYVMNSLR